VSQRKHVRITCLKTKYLPGTDEERLRLSRNPGAAVPAVVLGLRWKRRPGRAEVFTIRLWSNPQLPVNLQQELEHIKVNNNLSVRVKHDTTTLEGDLAAVARYSAVLTELTGVEKDRVKIEPPVRGIDPLIYSTEPRFTRGEAERVLRLWLARVHGIRSPRFRWDRV
jgi:hypothetical protein